MKPEKCPPTRKAVEGMKGDSLNTNGDARGFGAAHSGAGPKEEDQYRLLLGLPRWPA